MPVRQLQATISVAEFAELCAYDDVWGLDRHSEIIEPVAPAPVDHAAAFASMARARDTTRKATGNREPRGLNRCYGKAAE